MTRGQQRQLGAVEAEVVMTSLDAERLCDQIRGGLRNIESTAAEVAVALRTLKEAAGWKALGYTTWNDCVETEFHIGKRHGNRLAKYGEMLVELTEAAGLVGPAGPTAIGEAIPERAFRELPAETLEKLPAAVHEATAGKHAKNRADAAAKAIAAARSEASPDDTLPREVQPADGLADTAAEHARGTSPSHAGSASARGARGPANKRVAPDQGPGGNGTAEPGGVETGSPQEPPAPKPVGKRTLRAEVQNIAVTTAEALADVCELAELRDARNRLDQAYTVKTARVAPKGNGVSLRGVGRPRPIRESPKQSDCIHPPNQVRDGFCFGCGKEGVKPGGRRSAS